MRAPSWQASPNAPSMLSAAPDAAAARQRLVVRQMLKYGTLR